MRSEHFAALKPWLEDAGAVTRSPATSSRRCSNWPAWASRRAASTHDVMLYAFLLDAEPGGCALEEQARRRLDLKLGSAPEQHADIALELYHQLAPAVDGPRPAQAVRRHRAAADARAGAHGAHRHPHRSGGTEAALQPDGDGDRAAHRRNPRAGRQAVQHQLAAATGAGAVRGPEPARARRVRQGQGRSRPRPTCWRNWPRDHEIVRKVLEYRQLTKLKGTYVDALPALIDPRPGACTPASTRPARPPDGSRRSNPNLQNIPIRTELGREIRAAFVPREGWKLLVADYSQIELRLLAHMSGDPLLVEAFRNGEDIHTRTAAEVHGRAADDGDAGGAARRQGGELRHRLRHQRLRAGGAAGHLARRGREVHQELLRALRRACGVSSTRPSPRCGARA